MGKRCHMVDVPKRVLKRTKIAASPLGQRTGCNCSEKNEQNELWTIKFEPKVETDLTLSRSKLVHLRKALEESNLLLLEGPPGCGKLSALKVLCREKGIKIKEWDIAPFGLELGQLGQLFLRFLSSRASSVLSYEDSSDEDNNGAKHQNISEDNAKHKGTAFLNKKREVRLIKDAPYSLFTRELSNRFFLQFKAAIKSLISRPPAVSPLIVFILNCNDYTILQYLIPDTLFGSNINFPCHFMYIKVPAVTPIGVKKILTRILTHEGIPPSLIKKIATCFVEAFPTNDVRSLLTTLQFFLVPELKKRVSTTTSLSLSTYNHLFRSPYFDMMHALGRLLYNKRIERKNVPLQSKIMQQDRLPTPTFVVLSSVCSLLCYAKLDTTLSLSSPVFRQPFYEKPTLLKKPRQFSADVLLPKLSRPLLYFDLEDLLLPFYEQMHQLVDLLFSNYLSFYGSINDATEVMYQFSFIDAFTKRCPEDLVLLCRAILDSNIHPQNPACKKNPKSTPHVQDDYEQLYSGELGTKASTTYNLFKFTKNQFEVDRRFTKKQFQESLAHDCIQSFRERKLVDGSILLRRDVSTDIVPYIQLIAPLTKTFLSKGRILSAVATIPPHKPQSLLPLHLDDEYCYFHIKDEENSPSIYRPYSQFCNQWDVTTSKPYSMVNYPWTTKGLEFDDTDLEPT